MIEKHRLHSLHAIRGWAALFVVIAHAKYPFWSGGQAYLEKYPMENWGWWQYLLFSLDMFTSFASVFVIVFFVLSGFFIARSLVEKKYSPIFFYGDRIIRIYIPYFGSLLVGFLALNFAHYINPEIFNLLNPDRPYNRELIAAFNDLNWQSFKNALFFLPGESGMFFGINAPYWSLFFEALFYILIPFVVMFLRRFWFFVLAFVLHLLSFFIGSEWLSTTAFLLQYSIYFAFGVLLYELGSSKKTRLVMVKFVRKMTNVLIASSMIFMLSSIPMGLLHYKKIGFGFGMIGTGLLILWLLYGRRTALYNVSRKILVNDFSNFLGKISFSMYLIHVPILALLYVTWADITQQLVFYERIYWIPVMIIIPLGYLFYLIFEKNSLLLLKRYKLRFRR